MVQWLPEAEGNSETGSFVGHVRIYNIIKSISQLDDKIAKFLGNSMKIIPTDITKYIKMVHLIMKSLIQI